MFDESEPEPLTESDTPNHTKFYGTDTDADYDGRSRLDETATYEQHYNRLSLHNSGVFNGKWADENIRARQDRLALFDAISSQLELTTYQKTIARQAFDRLNLPHLTTRQIDTELVAVMVAALACRPDGRYYHPNRDESNNDPLFVALLDAFDYDTSALHSAYGKVLSAVEF